ncbi:Trans-resveratrol di-O-methyltransferase [Capsicum chinense]|nr:Trans-resveratrol di-O-methyltransferase [Capsicum chinense]
MRILTHAGFFIKTNKDTNELDRENISYVLTSTSHLLLKDERLSVIPYQQAQFDQIFLDPSHNLSQWFQNGESSTSPFAIAHGKPFFEYVEKEPKLNRVFNEFMASDARLVISTVIENCKAVFEGLKSLVDLGGGTGTVAKSVANAFPEINCTVLDLPHVVEGYEGSEYVSYVGGDMFKFIPPADVIFLESILHDWSDDYCIKILKKCKEAISSKENGGRLIIIDIVMDHNLDRKSYETQLFMHMLMMVGVNGKERSERMDLIDDVCHRTGDFNLCAASLRTDPHIRTADIKGLTCIMMEMCLDKAKGISSQIERIIKQATDRGFKECLEICLKASRVIFVSSNSIAKAIWEVSGWLVICVFKGGSPFSFTKSGPDSRSPGTMGGKKGRWLGDEGHHILGEAWVDIFHFSLVDKSLEYSVGYCVVYAKKRSFKE